VDRNSARSQSAEFRFWNYISVRRKNADPCLSPPIRLPQGHLPSEKWRMVFEVGVLVESRARNGRLFAGRGIVSQRVGWSGRSR
jgi:hypothetical protein